MKKAIALLSVFVLLLTGLSGCGKQQEITVATYNVKRFISGSQYDEIAEEIKSVGAEIIGFQEVTGPTETVIYYDDQMSIIAEKLGYKYFYFGVSLDDRGYGHGIVSKYPITKVDTTMFEAQNGEERSYDRAEIKVGNKTVVFYNTHLCLDGTGMTQAEQVGEMMNRIKKEKDKYSIVVGDLNAQPHNFMDVIDVKKFTPLNGGKDFTQTVATFPCGNEPRSPIDNIIVCDRFTFDAEKPLTVSHTKWSDHNMAYTTLTF